MYLLLLLLNLKRENMKLYKLMRKPPFSISASTWMKKSDNPVKSSSKSRKAVIIPLVLVQYGSFRAKLATMKASDGALITCFKEMRKSAKELVKNPKTGKRTIDDATLQELEKFATELGVTKIGYTKVNPDYIFRDFKILYDNAMILSMEMNRDAIKSAPSNEATKEIWRSYKDLGIVVNKIAEFLRERGINCHPSPAIGGDINTVPVAENSGIGAIGKNGLLITPEYGPSHRLAAVFIDVDNLPVKTINENEHLWIKDFCETCNHCVKTCPGKAILKVTKFLADGYPQYIEREKCALPFSENCCTCINSCPFIHGNYDKIKSAFQKNKEQ